ncbi:GNAT family N-acetyltransferase [Sphaerisporangium sp. NPDC004334]
MNRRLFQPIVRLRRGPGARMATFSGVRIVDRWRAFSMALPTKLVLVVRADLPPAAAVNAAAVLGLSLGARLPESLGPTPQDASGDLHAGLNPHPVPVLSATPDQLRELYAKARARDDTITVGFNETARRARDYNDFLTALATTPGEEIDHVAVAVYGPRNRVSALTKRLPLHAPVEPVADRAAERDSTAFELAGPVLEGELVRLEPLTRDHAGDLAVAAEEDRGSYAYTWVPRAGEVERYIGEQLERAATGKLAPYAQVARSSGRAVGVTAFWDPRPWPRSADRLHAVEIGFTWLAASAQGTGINTEAKLLMFRHAFESWNAARVDLKTDARNGRSRAAIAGVGARFEGVLRNWSPSWAPGEQGALRDSAIFSIVAEEWPECRAMLEARVAAMVKRGDPDTVDSL